MSQTDVVWAFVQQSQNTGHVAFSKRGNSPRGYVNVFGPSHDPRDPETARVVVDHNGSVAFKDELVANELRAPPLPHGEMAPGTGAAKWGLSSQTIMAKYSGADELVRAIVAAMKLHANW